MFDSKEERDLAVRLALGRIFRLGSRPTQPGDVEDYETCRALILDALDPEGDQGREALAQVPNYVRDRNRGARGD